MSGDLSPLRVIIMTGETAFSSSGGRYTTLSRRRPSTEVGTRQTPASLLRIISATRYRGGSVQFPSQLRRVQYRYC
jgi:hypothetical protein